MPTTTRWRRWRVGALVLTLALVGCGDSDSGDHGHDAAREDGHEHRPEVARVDYREATELFVEFSSLVVGRGTPMAIHVTRLDGFQPLTSGTVDVRLERDGALAARFRVSSPVREGLFRPTVTPRRAGEYQLVVEVREGDLEARHELGTVTVFAEADEVVDPDSGEQGAIAFSKEQQWTTPFATTEARERPLRASVPGFATVRAPADNGATVRAPVDGYLAAGTPVLAGTTVEAGTILGHLLPRRGADGDLGRLLEERERARVNRDRAVRDVRRLTTLHEQGAVPRRRLQEARDDLRVAEAELDTVQQRLAGAGRGDGIERIALRTPVAGEVVRSRIEPGAPVTAGETLFQIAGTTRRWLEVRVPERYAGELRGTSGVWLDGPDGEPVVLDEAAGARVVQAETAIDPDSRTAGVIIEYPVDKGPHLIGARLAAHVHTEAPTSRLAIPRSAVINDAGRDVVYVQTGGERFERRPVALGRVDGAWVEVERGLDAGERVVSSGAYTVRLAASGGGDIGHGHAH
ncbi:MAG: efflux RND transporter periplasmic adaptor subunit [Pseudomonadota bacterium]